MKMPFAQAAARPLYFGKYRGRTLDDIGSTDDGLLYLDWLLSRHDPTNFYGRLDSGTLESLTAYLGDPTIAKELDAALKGRNRP